MTTIHKDKEECQAALAQGEHLKHQILLAGVTFRLSQYCSLSTARVGGNEQGESYQLTYFPAVCSEQEHHLLYNFMLPQFLWSLADAAGKKPISILHTKGYLRHTLPYDILNIMFPTLKTRTPRNRREAIQHQLARVAGKWAPAAWFQSHATHTDRASTQ